MRRLVFLLLAACAAAAAEATTLVLSGGTVIDGYGNPPIANGVVVIENDRIVTVGGSEVAVPAGAQVISTEGMTVLPGLWDVQVNLMRLGHGDAARWNQTYGPLAEKVVMPIAARQLLQAGVTTARDGPAPLEAAIHVRERVRNHLIEGPTLMVSGPLLRKTVTPGNEDWQWTVTGAEDARAKVLRLSDAGVDYILLADVDTWTPEELTAAVGEARLRRLPVYAYANTSADVVAGVGAQFDGFLGSDMSVGPFPENAMLVLNQRLANTAARPLAWSPAISALLNFEALHANREPLDDPRVSEALPPLVAADVLGSLANLDRGAWLDTPNARSQSSCARLRQLDEAKLTLLVGSDAGLPGHLHSRATWQEIDFWVRQCGLPVERAIRAATHDAASAMGVGHQSGTLSPGKFADVIAVRGDVLRNPALLQSVDIVIKRGRRIR